MVSSEPTRVSNRWVVVVTYGTRPYSEFACVRGKSAANILSNVARSRGYRNPRVMKLHQFLEERANYMIDRAEQQMHLKFDYLATVYGPEIAELKRAEWVSRIRSVDGADRVNGHIRSSS